MNPPQLDSSKREEPITSGLLFLNHPKQSLDYEQQVRGSSQQLTKTQKAKCEQIYSVLNPNLIGSRSYRETMTEIINCFSSMDSLTVKLQQKVEGILIKQQEQFVESYKQHMRKIKEEFCSVEQKIEQYEKKILYYENQGEMSHLVIKCNKLEEECKNLYKSLAIKDKLLRDNQLTIKVHKSEIKRYEKEIKLLLREKNNLLAKLSKKQLQNQPQLSHLTTNPQDQSLLKEIQSINSTNNLLFPTQCQQQSKPQKQEPSTEYQFQQNPNICNQQLNICKSQKSLTIDFSLAEKNFKLNNKISNSLLSKIQNESPIDKIPSKDKTCELKLKRQISKLKKKNQILICHQSQILDTRSNLQQFFIKSVNEIKHQITIRKKIKECTFQQWRKEDKIQLLIKVLSNQEVLVYLYDKLFTKRKSQTVEVHQEGHDKLIRAKISHTTSMNCHPKNRLIEKVTLIGQTSSNGIVDTYKNNQTINNQKLTNSKSRDKLLSLKRENSIDVQERRLKALSHAKKRVSKHISENSMLPKIHFHLQY